MPDTAGGEGGHGAAKPEAVIHRYRDYETDNARDACNAPSSESETLKLYPRNGVGVQKNYGRR
jgi:hypothetical protein